MNNRFEPFDIFRGNLSHVLGEGEWTRVMIIKPTVAVKAAINSDNVKAPFDELRPENGADISIDTGNQYSHFRHFCLTKSLCGACKKLRCTRPYIKCHSESPPPRINLQS